jgi:hypothetical protein
VGDTSRFSKVFPFLQRFHFPPQGDPLNPQQVTRDVQLVHEIFRADAKHAIRLVAIDDTRAGAGANIDVTIVAEPPSGMVAIPICISLAHDQAANIQPCSIQTAVSGNLADLPTGIWPALEWISIGPTGLTANHFVCPPVRIPIPRGNSLFVRWSAPPVGRNVIARSFVAQVPIECVDWTEFFCGNYTRTEGI